MGEPALGAIVAALGRRPPAQRRTRSRIMAPCATDAKHARRDLAARTGGTTGAGRPTATATPILDSPDRWPYTAPTMSVLARRAPTAAERSMHQSEVERLLAPYPELLTVTEVAAVVPVPPRSIQRRVQVRPRGR